MARPTSTGSRKSRLRLAAVLAAVAVGIVAAIAGGAFAQVSTDQADYSPGSVVTISGGNDANGLPGYTQGHTVTVDATADNGLWEQTCSDTVAADGTWSCQVTLSSDPAIAVGSYHYTATSTDGNGNPISETGTFTDGNFNSVSGYVKDSSNNPIDGATVTCTSGCNSTTQFTTTNASGYYVFDSTTAKLTFSGGASGNPYTLTLTASKTGYTSNTVTFSGDAGSTFTNENITLTPSPPADNTAPVITFQQTPDGSNGWFKTAPATVKVIATDTDDGGVASLLCKLDGSPITLTGTGSTSTTMYGYVSTSTDDDHTVACQAADSTGNTAFYADNTTHLMLDTVAPTISDDGTTDTATGNDGTNDWYNHDVTVNFSASDSTSGLATCTSPWTADTTGEGTNQTASSGPCSDVAGNTNDGISSSGYHVDKTNPTVGVTGVADGATYTLGSVPTAGCSTTDSLSGVQTNASLSTSGGPVGSITATCSGGEDYAGNTAPDVIVTYDVIYNFTGFFQPVNSDPDYCNTVKAGSAIPMKFSLDGYQGMNIIQIGYPTATPGSCTGATTDPILPTETVTAGNSSLSYDATSDQYIYVWKTDKSWTGKAIRFTIMLNDGTTHYARFLFTK